MNEKNKGIPFRLVDITTERFAVFQENLVDEKVEFDIELGLEINTDPNSHTVGMFTNYSFTQQDKCVLTLRCGCHFEIEESYWNQHLSENKITLDRHLLTHFLVLTVGTSRGVIHSKKPLWLKNLLLPTLNVSSIISENVVFDFSTD